MRALHVFFERDTIEHRNISIEIAETVAQLHSEDSQFETFFELSPGDIIGNYDEEQWQSFSIALVQGSRRLSFASAQQPTSEAHPTAVEGEKIALADGSFLERHRQDPHETGYLFCRAPKDEVAQLITLLKRLAERKITTLRFETLEPSIELEISRQEGRADGEAGQVYDDGLKVQLFIDAGNVETEISRWDALGIRFFTTQAHLEQFIEALQKEFGC